MNIKSLASVTPLQKAKAASSVGPTKTAAKTSVSGASKLASQKPGVKSTSTQTKLPSAQHAQQLIDGGEINVSRAVDLSQQLDIHQGSLPEQLEALDKVLTPVNLLASTTPTEQAQETSETGGFLNNNLFTENWGSEESLLTSMTESQSFETTEQHAIGSLSSENTNFQGTQRALVVGNSDYKELGVLEGAEVDVDRTSAALIEHGFETPVVLENVSGKVALNALSELVTNSQPGDTVTFVYSGHGSIRDFDGTDGSTDEFLVGVNAQGEGENIGYGDLQTIIEQAQEKGVQLNIVLDACQSGAFVRDESIRKCETLTQGADFVEQLVEKHGADLSPEAQKEIGNHLQQVDDNLAQASADIALFDQIGQLSVHPEGDLVELIGQNTSAEGSVSPELMNHLNTLGVDEQTVNEIVSILGKVDMLQGNDQLFVTPPSEKGEVTFRGFNGPENNSDHSEAVLNYLMDQRINPFINQAQQSLALAREQF